MDERGAFAGAAVLDRLGHRGVARNRIGAIDLGKDARRDISPAQQRIARSELGSLDKVQPFAADGTCSNSGGSTFF